MAVEAALLAYCVRHQQKEMAGTLLWSSVFLMGIVSPLEGDPSAAEVLSFVNLNLCRCVSELSGTSAKLVAKSPLFSAPLVLALTVVPLVAVYAWTREQRRR